MTESSANPLISIGFLSKRTGVSISAIRFYEGKGLIFPLRNRGGQRRFMRSDIRRLSFIQIARNLGFSLDDIASQLDTLPQQRAPNKADWAKISQDMRSNLNARIAQMERLRDRLDGCIGCGCLSMQVCALYNTDDKLGKNGPGPQYLISPAL